MSQRSNSLLASAISAFLITLSAPAALAQEDCNEAQARNSNEEGAPERTDSYVCTDSESGDQAIFQNNVPPFAGEAQRAFAGSIIGGDSLTLTNNAQLNNANPLAQNAFLRGGIYVLDALNFNFINNAAIDVAGLIGVLVENSSGTIDLGANTAISAGTGVSVSGSTSMTVNNAGNLNATGVGMSFVEVAALTLNNTGGEITSSGDAAIDIANASDSLLNSTVLISNEAAINGAQDAIRVADVGRFTLSNQAGADIAASAGAGLSLAATDGATRAAVVDVSNAGSIDGADAGISLSNIPTAGIANLAGGSIDSTNGFAIDATVSDADVAASVVVGNADTGMISGGAGAIAVNNITTTIVNNAGTISATADAAIIAAVSGDTAPVASLRVNNETSGMITADLNAIQVMGLSQLTVDNAGTLSGLNGAAIEASVTTADINNTAGAIGVAGIGGLSLQADQVSVDNADGASIATSSIDLNIGASTATVSNAGSLSSLIVTGLLDADSPEKLAVASVNNTATGTVSDTLSFLDLLNASVVNSGSMDTTTVVPAILYADNAQASLTNEADASIASAGVTVDVDGGDLFTLSNSGDVSSTGGIAIDVLDTQQTVIVNDGDISSTVSSAIQLADTLELEESASATAQISNSGTISGGADVPALFANQLATLQLSNTGSMSVQDGLVIEAIVDTLLLTNSGTLQTDASTTGEIEGLFAEVSDLVAVNEAGASMGITAFDVVGDSSVAASFTNAGELAFLDMIGVADTAMASVTNSGRIAGQVLVDGMATDAGALTEAIVLETLATATVTNTGDIEAVIDGENLDDEGVAIELFDVDQATIDNGEAGSIVGSRSALSFAQVTDASVTNQGSLSVADMTTATSGAAIEMLGLLDGQTGEAVSSFLLNNSGSIDGQGFLALDLELLALASITNSGSLQREGGYVAQVSDTDRIAFINSGMAVSDATDPLSTRFGVDLSGRIIQLSNAADGVVGESQITLNDNSLASATVTNEGRLAKLDVNTSGLDPVNGNGFLVLNNSGQMDLSVAEGEDGASGSAEGALVVNGVASVSITNSGTIAAEGTARGPDAPESELFDGQALSATIGRLFALSNEMSGSIEGASTAVAASGYGSASVTNAGSISATGNDDSIAVVLSGDRTRTQTVGSGESATTAPFASATVSNSGDIHGSNLAVNVDDWQSVTLTNTGNLTADQTAAVQVNADQLTVSNGGLILGGNEDNSDADSALLALDAMVTEALTFTNTAEGSMAVLRVQLDANDVAEPAEINITNAGEIAAVFVEDIGAAANSEFSLTNTGSIAGVVDGQSAGEIAAGVDVENFAKVVIDNMGSVKGNGATEDFGTEQNPMPVLIGEGVVLSDAEHATVTNFSSADIFGRNVGLAMFDVATTHIVNAGTVRANNYGIEIDNLEASEATVINMGTINVLGGVDLSTAIPGFENAAIIANDMTDLTVNHTGGSILGDLFAGAGTEDSLLVENASMAQATMGATEQLVRGFETIEFDGEVEFLSATSISNADNALAITQKGSVTLFDSFTAAGSYALTSTANLIFRIDEDTAQSADGSLLTVDSLSVADEAVITFSVDDANYFLEEGDSRSYQLISLASDSAIADEQVLIDSVLVKLEEDSIDTAAGLALSVVPITIEDYLNSGATQAEANVGIAAREALFGPNSSVADNDPVKLRMQEANREGFNSLIDFFESLLTDTSGRTVNTAGASLFAAQNNIRGRSAGLAGGISSGSAMAESGWWISALNIDFEQSEKDGHEGFEGDGDGFTLGIDHWFNRDLNVGIAASVLNSDTESESGNDSLETDGNLISLYTTGRLINGFLLHTQFTSATYDNDSVREVAGTKAEASYEADQMAVSVLLSRPITSGNWQWTPSASLTWSELDIPAYQESGSTAALAVDGQTYNENLIGLGLALAYVHQSNNGNWFLPRLRVDVMHDAAGDDVEITSRFLVGGQRFVTPGVEHEAMRVSASTGFQWLIGNYSSVDFDLNYYQSGDYESTSVEAKLRYEF